MFPFRTVSSLFLIGAGAAAAHAGALTTETKIVRVPRAALVSPGAARNFEARLADAALEVCGASSQSLAEMRYAVKRSRCWRDAYDGAITQLRDARGVGRLSARMPGDGVGKP